MAESTTNYRLTKPLESEYYDVNISNRNMDIIDETLYTKVDKVNGKSLSSNDFTDEDKTKLDDITKSISFILISDMWVRDGAVFSCSVSNRDVKASDNPLLLPVLPSSNNVADLKAYKKNFAYLIDGTTSNGSIRLRAIKKPTIDLSVVLKGA